MKKLIALFMMIGLFLLTPGCGPSEAEYQQLKDENERLKKELATINKEYETCQEATYDYYEKERPMLEARIEALEAQRNSAGSSLSSSTPTSASQSSATVEADDNEPPSGSSSGYYVVRRGDTINAIATKTNVSKTELMRINNIRNEARIFAGQRLKLPSGSSNRQQARVQPKPEPKPEPEPAPTPPPRTAPPAPKPPEPEPGPSGTGGRVVFYYVRPHDTLPRIAAKTGVSVETLKRLNSIEDDTPLRVGQRLFLR